MTRLTRTSTYQTPGRTALANVLAVGIIGLSIAPIFVAMRLWE